MAIVALVMCNFLTHTTCTHANTHNKRTRKHTHTHTRKVVPAVFLPQGSSLCFLSDTDSSFHSQFFFFFMLLPFMFLRIQKKENLKHRNADRGREQQRHKRPRREKKRHKALLWWNNCKGQHELLGHVSKADEGLLKHTCCFCSHSEKTVQRNYTFCSTQACCGSQLSKVMKPPKWRLGCFYCSPHFFFSKFFFLPSKLWTMKVQ